MPNDRCFCGGDGSYTDYNCGQAFKVTCPHCDGTGNKALHCRCVKTRLTCGGRRGAEIDTRPDTRTEAQKEDDDIHWNFMD